MRARLAARLARLARLARRLRMLAVCYWLSLKTLAASAFDGIFQVVWPLFFATTAFLVFRQNGDPAALVYAGLGAGWRRWVAGCR